MPRKAAAASAGGDDATTSRRSTRIAAKPAAPAAPPKKAAAPRKKRAAEKTDEDAKEEPAAKKVKGNDGKAEVHAHDTHAEKPTSKKDDKEAPASKDKKPASKAKPTSKAKPASSGKPASSSKKGHETHAEPIAEEDAEMEDKENHAGSSSALKEIHIGDTIPELKLVNEKGQEVDVGKLAGAKGLVLFIVPKADTPGCTTQACNFRDQYAEFEKLGYNVYSLSADKPAALDKWQTKHSFTYSLLSDPDRKLIAALGAGKGPSKRSHVVFEKGSGKLVEKKIGVKPADSTKDALAFIQKHHS